MSITKLWKVCWGVDIYGLVSRSWYPIFFMVGPLSLIHCRWLSHLYNKNDLLWKNICSSQPRKFLWSTAGLKWNRKNYYLTYFTIQAFSWSLDIKLVLHFSDLVVSSQLSFLLLSLPLRATNSSNLNSHVVKNLDG